MGWPPASPWTEDRDAVAMRLHHEGKSGGEIARELGGGLSRSAVIARLTRLRNAGAPVAPRRLNPVSQSMQRRRDEMARLAEAFAEGAATLRDAAAVAGLTEDRAYNLWAAIKAELGAQAQ